MINVLIADDHQLFLDGLDALLKEHAEISVIGKANNGNEVLSLLEKGLSPDIAILDVEMQPLNGVETAQFLRKSYPKIKILILSMHKDKNYIVRLMNLGVSGYVLKNKSKEQLVHAIRQVAAGSVYFGIDVLEELANPSKEAPAEMPNLTDREVQVLKQIGEGKTTKEIAALLYIQDHTVNTHKRNLRHKLNAPNEKYLVRLAIKFGLIDP